MSNFIIQIGIINKKLLIPFALAMLLLFINLLGSCFPAELDSPIMQYLAISLAQMSIIIVPKFKIFSSKREQLFVQKKRTYKSCCHFFVLLILIIGATIILNVVSSLIGQAIAESGREEDPRANLTKAMEFAINDSIETIFICVLTIILFRDKYFIHHIISLIVFIIICLIIDFIVGNLNEIRTYLSSHIFLYILYLLFDSMISVYQKYMMEKLYYSLWTIMFSMGIFTFFILIGLVIVYVRYASQIEEGKDNPFIFITSYFQQVKASIIIFKFVMTYSLHFFYHLFFILTLYYFTPNHILISMEVSKMFSILINPIQGSKIIVFILFILNFFCLFIYLEILELNFCGLNKNVKRIIQIRANKEMILSKQTEAEMIDISMDENEPGYYTKKDYEDREFSSENNSRFSDEKTF